MILRYTVFIALLLLLSALVSFIIKPPLFDSLAFDTSNDPLARLKKSYAKMIWKSVGKEHNYVNRFRLIKRVLEYDPSSKDIYVELCEGKEKYLKADIELKDFLRLLREGPVDCYLDTLIGLSRYDEAIDFLKREHVRSSDDEADKAYIAKLKTIQNEKNILDISKAVEKYYQRTKTYPGDILVLVSEGLLPLIPDEPYGGQYFISKQGQVMTTTQMEKQ